MDMDWEKVGKALFEEAQTYMDIAHASQEANDMRTATVLTQNANLLTSLAKALSKGAGN